MIAQAIKGKLTMTKYKTVIGRAETIDILQYFKTSVPAKIDTGAYASSIHVENIKEETRKGGKKVLSFNLLSNHPVYADSREIEIENYKKITVENSFGVSEERYKIELKVKIAGKTFSTPFTLANRSKKAFPILLGRTLLNNRFIVDTSVVHVSGTELKKKLKDWLKKDDTADD